MRLFINKNLALLAGIVLPVVLVVFISVNLFMIQAQTLPPRYDLLYLSNGYSPFKIVDNKLVLEYYPQTTNTNQPTRLYLFNVKTNQSQEIKIDYSNPTQLTNKMLQVDLLILTTFTIDQNLQSPDGYTFTLTSPFMLSRAYHYGGMIVKNGRKINIGSDPYIRFVGWVIPKGKGH